MEKLFRRGFSLFLLFLSTVWLESGYSKITSGNFPSILAPILIKFSAKNPYNWYRILIEKSFLLNAPALGLIIQWAESICGLVIFFASIYFLFSKNINRFLLIILAVALLMTAFLNLNFWLAAGWTGASTASLNQLMLLFELSVFALLLPQIFKKS